VDPITIAFINLAIGVAASLIGQMVKKPPPKAKPSGISGNISTGGDVPLSFILGRFGTAGHLDYVGTYGTIGDTPNAFLVHAVSVQDLPARGLNRVAVFGEWVEFGDEEESRGYPAVGRYAGRLWMKFFDGTQTSADDFMLDKFGDHPNRPWDSDMIGRGVAWVRMVARFDREIWNGFPEYFFEVDGIACDDPRGDDSQDNPMVHLHQGLQGIYFGDEWVWGPQGIAASRLPEANWEAGMDLCDAAVDKKGGGTEPRFRAGAEIFVDQQPIDIFAELLETCLGRIAEIGGTYKILVAEPGDPVASFTDEDIRIDEGQNFDPFPGLESTYNGVNATYPEPSETYKVRGAPELRDTDLEEEDDARRLPADVSLTFVPYARQVQRLMKGLKQENRRFRNHALPMPPEWWEFEVLDTVSWTSARNGYDGKDFLITAMDDASDARQLVAIKELDGSDYDWSAEDDEQDFTVVPIETSPPPAQPMTGWAASPYTIVDAASAPRRPAILVEFAGLMADVRAVRIQARLDGDIVFDGEAPYDPSEATPSRVLSGAWCVGNEEYEVAGKLLPFSGRGTEWSAWLAVTTPDVGYAPEDLGATLQNMLDFFGVSIRDINEQMMLTSSLGADQDAANYSDRVYVLNQVSVGDATTYAASTEALLLAVGVDGSTLADALSAIEAASGDVTAGFLTRMTASASPGGSWVRYGTQIKAGFADDFVTVSDFWEVNSVSGLSRRVMKASETYIVDNGGNVLALFASGGAYLNAARIEDASITNAKIADAAITSAKIGTAAITSAKIGDLEVATIKIANAAVTDIIVDGPDTSGNFANSTSYATISSIVLPGGDYVTPVGAYIAINISNTGTLGNWLFDYIMEIQIDGGYVQIASAQSGPHSYTEVAKGMMAAQVPPLPAGSYTVRTRVKTNYGDAINHTKSRVLLAANGVKK
jgi:hypothetical protein